MKFCPFSHLPGTRALLPCSELVCELFPALVRLYELKSMQLIAEYPRKIVGPVEQFTVIQNQDLGFIQVSGKSPSGFFRYEIYPAPKGITFEKRIRPIKHRERLHFGSHKKLEWPHLPLRKDIKEILPLWFWLSQTLPEIPQDLRIFEGESLFSRLLHDTSAAAYRALYQAAFSGIFVPRTKDLDYQGFTLPVVSDDTIHPLLILQESYPLIRKLFFEETSHGLSFLPKLDREFHAGSLVHLKTLKRHTISIEWTKHTIRTVLIEAACDDEVSVTLQKDIKQFRIKTNKKERGTCVKNYDSIILVKGKKYLLDNFTG